MPLATVCTPNIPEAEILTGYTIQTEEDINSAAQHLLSLGLECVVIKGGHLSGKHATDTVFIRGEQPFKMKTERVDTKHTHGTGCTFSAAITAEMAKGRSIEAAIIEAKKYVQLAIRHPLNIGHGFGPTNHFAYHEQRGCAMSMFFDLNKYFVMGTINCKRDPLLVLEEALQAGVTMFQLREKGENALKGDEYIQFARQCQKLCQIYKVPFIINDDVELALNLDADGIHVGQEDIKIEKFRSLAKNKIVGVSVHTMEQLELAMENGADYAGIGPIYQTTSKDDARAPVGLMLLEEVKSRYPQFPIVAIGGISHENSFRVRQTGANGVAVISAISQSNNIKETVNIL